MKNFRWTDFILLLLAGLCFVLISPKWTIPLAAWLGPAFLLYFFRKHQWWLSLGGSTIVLLGSGYIAQSEVVPMPQPFFLVYLLISSAMSLLPYVVDRLIHQRIKGFLSTLVFPLAAVSLEFANSFSGGGTWGVIAYTQYEFSALTQLASVTGLWGISFLIYWTASALNWIYHYRRDFAQLKKALLMYGSVFFAILLFGSFRLSGLFSDSPPTVRIAGISVENIHFAEKLYALRYGEAIRVNPKVSQTDPDLQKINGALIAFIEQPEATEFQAVYPLLDSLYEELFRLSRREARAGARLILWSEANAMVVEGEENSLIRKGQLLAREEQVYLLMSMAVLLPGKITPERKLMENKLLLIDPQGEVISEYFKNRPVPFAESSVPGDGQVPLISTDFGRISPVVCYDADFQQLMLQTGRQGTDILLIPSGDWAAIAPHHSQMAVFRGIENGCTVVRQVSHGTSVATDAYGRTLAQMDFFSSEAKVMVAQVPKEGVFTIYAQIRDSFAIMCVLGFIGMAGTAIYHSHFAKVSNKHGQESTKKSFGKAQAK